MKISPKEMLDLLDKTMKGCMELSLERASEVHWNFDILANKINLNLSKRQINRTQQIYEYSSKTVIYS